MDGDKKTKTKPKPQHIISPFTVALCAALTQIQGEFCLEKKKK